MRLFSLDRTLALSETQRDDFKVISEEIDQIDTIVQNFLEFSRPPKLKMQQVSPSEVVDLVVQLLRHRLASNDVTISVERLRPLPEIQADPEQLKEVLVNLVVNACEAMSAGGAIRITEELQHIDARQQAVIRVQDQGPGVPETLKERIFQPFFTTKEEGTGLGLSIAARIIAEHGGWLSLDSREGRGTTFTISLPAESG
jgi:signal transduction histidine kinase